MSPLAQAAAHSVAPVDPVLRLKRRLDQDERLLWQGRPIPSRFFRKGFALYFFAIPWMAFALFWESMALGMTWSGGDQPHDVPFAASIVFPLFGLPFIAVGLWLLAQPFVLRRRAAHTLYAVTTKRALIFVEDKTEAWYSYDLASLPEHPAVKTFGDGSGSILFLSGPAEANVDAPDAMAYPSARWRNRRPQQAPQPALRGFEYVSDPDAVLAALQTKGPNAS